MGALGRCGGGADGAGCAERRFRGICAGRRPHRKASGPGESRETILSTTAFGRAVRGAHLSDGQTLATPLPATRKDGPPGGRAHALSEAVLVFAPPLARLKGPLHDDRTWKRVTPYISGRSMRRRGLSYDPCSRSVNFRGNESRNPGNRVRRVSNGAAILDDPVAGRYSKAPPNAGGTS